MTKKLDEGGMQSELAGSAFFAQASKPADAQSPSPKDPEPIANTGPNQAEAPPTQSSASPKPPATPVSPMQASEPLADQASMQASDDASMIEQLRKTVKSVGKEVSFIRMTIEEKQQLLDIVYTYRRQGVKTSENEISRIAINCLIVDYHASGENSILARVIAALLA